MNNQHTEDDGLVYCPLALFRCRAATTGENSFLPTVRMEEDGDQVPDWVSMVPCKPMRGKMGSHDMPWLLSSLTISWIQTHCSTSMRLM